MGAARGPATTTAMQHDSSTWPGDGAPERVPPPPNAPRASAVRLHDTLAQLATSMAAAAPPPPRHAPSPRDQARSLLGDVTGRRAPDGPTARREAREAVTEFAARLRADGEPPERVLVVIKAAVRDATPGVLDAMQLHALTDDVVRWSIEAYYAP